MLTLKIRIAWCNRTFEMQQELWRCFSRRTTTWPRLFNGIFWNLINYVYLISAKTNGTIYIKKLRRFYLNRNTVIAPFVEWTNYLFVKALCNGDRDLFFGFPNKSRCNLLGWVLSGNDFCFLRFVFLRKNINRVKKMSKYFLIYKNMSQIRKI